MPRRVELTLDPEHAERFYAENPGAAERAMRERHQLNERAELAAAARKLGITLYFAREHARVVVPVVAVRRPAQGAARPRERREARHQARSTSSADPGDPEPPSRCAATRMVVA